MPRIATKLAPAHKGGFIARKVIPLDVREAYAKLYGQRTEERLNTGPMPVSLARAKHREWSSEIEARIANIRAQRNGDGRALTPGGLIPSGGLRSDAYPESGGYPGSDFDLMRDQLLDRYGYYRALLTHGLGDYATHQPGR